mgnify:CR=1 FL=1
MIRIERHAQHGVFNQRLSGHQGSEGCIVELLHIDLRSLGGEWVDQEDKIRHFVAETQGIQALSVIDEPHTNSDSTELPRQYNQVVLADGENIDDVAVLVLHYIRSEILAEQLARCTHTTHNVDH